MFVYLNTHKCPNTRMSVNAVTDWSPSYNLYSYSSILSPDDSPVTHTLTCKHTHVCIHQHCPLLAILPPSFCLAHISSLPLQRLIGPSVKVLSDQSRSCDRALNVGFVGVTFATRSSINSHWLTHPAHCISERSQ